MPKTTKILLTFPFYKKLKKIILFLGLVFVCEGNSTEYTWIGPTPFDYGWGFSDNWNPTGVPGISDAANLGSSVSNHVLLGGNQSVNQITVNSQAYTIGGDGLSTLYSLTIGGASASITVGNVGSPAATFNCPIILSSNLTVSSSYQSTFNQPISGNFSVTYQSDIDPCTVIIAAPCSYTGTTIIEGTVHATSFYLSGSGSLFSTNAVSIDVNSTFDISGISGSTTSIGPITGSGTINLDVKNLSFGNGSSTPFTFSGSITGSAPASTGHAPLGSITFAGGSTCILNTDNSTNDFCTIVASGTLQLQSLGSISNRGTLTVDHGAVFDASLVTSPMIGGLAGGSSSSPGGVVYVGTNTLTILGWQYPTFYGQIAQAPSTTGGNVHFQYNLADCGQSIAGICTYTGSTTIDSLVDVSLNSGGVLYSGLSSPGNLIANGSLILNNCSSQTVGSLTGAGNVTFSNTNSISFTFGQSVSSDFTFNGIFKSSVPSLVNAGEINLNAGTYTATLAGNSSSYYFNTKISSGTISLTGLGAVSQYGSLTLSGGNFDISLVTPATNITIGDLIALGTANTINLGSINLTFGTSNSTIFNGVIQGSGSIFKTGSGDVSFGGSNTFTGSVTIQQGMISTPIAGIGSISSITIDAGAVLEVTSSGTFSPASGILGAGDFVDLAAGTLTLNGDNSGFFGNIKIKGGGVLAFTNANALGTGSSIIFSGSSGTLQNGVVGSTTLSGELQIKKSGTIDTFGNTVTFSGSLTGNETLNVTSSVVNSGTIELQNYTDFTGTLSLRNANAILSGTTPSFGGQIQLQNQALVFFASSNSGTFSNTITGNGSVTIHSGGTVSFTGQNNYSGLTSIAVGNLQINSLEIIGDVKIFSGCNLILQQVGESSYNSTLTGSGNVLIQGDSFTTFLQNSPLFTGIIKVFSPSSLEIDANYGSANIDVKTGATFSGNGVVGNLSCLGTFIAGDPGVGILTVEENATFGSSSVYQVYITTKTSNEVIANVEANLDGSVIINPSENGFYGIQRQYVILQSPSIVGTFANVETLDPRFAPSLIYTSNQVILNVAIANPFYKFPFGNYNEEQVGENLNTIFENNDASEDLKSILIAMENLSITDINNALNQLHPAAFSAISDLQAELGAQLLSLFARNPELSCGCHGKSRAWVQPFGNWLKQAHHGMQRGFHATTRGLAFGYDVELLNCWTLGLGGAYSKTDLRWSRHAGYSYVETAIGAVYSDLWFGDFYLGLSGYLGKDFYKLHRRILYSTIDRQANSSPNAIDAAGQFKAMYVFGTKSFFLYPYALVDYMALDNSSFTEHGADSLNLHVSRYKSENLRAQGGFGMRFIDRNIKNSFCISPLFSMGYVLEHPLHRSHFHSKFQGQTLSFKSKGWNHSWQLLNLELGLTFSYKCFSLDAEYIADVSTDSMDDFFNQRANFNFKLNF